jgi:replicative DNA helicase
MEARTPVHSKSAERALIGCILVDPRVFPEIEAAVDATDFYIEANRVVFRAILEVYSKRASVDVLLLLEHIEAQGQLERIGDGRPGTPADLAKYESEVPSAANWQHYADIVLALSRQRRLAHTLEVYADRCYARHEDALVLAQEVSVKANDLLQTKRSTDFMTMADIDIAWSRQFEARQRGERGSYITCGIPRVDELVGGGFHFGRSYWTAGLSKMGKTKFTMALVKGMLDRVEADAALELDQRRKQAARAGEAADLPSLEALLADRRIAVDWYTAENTAPDLYQRMIASTLHTPETALRNAHQNRLADNQEWQGKLMRARLKLRLLDIRWRFDARPKLRDIVLNTRQRIKELGHSRLIVVIDYIQRVDAGHTGSRAEYQNVTDASMTLSGLAIELGYMGMYVAHFNRAGASRSIPRPSDLRGSGQIEQDVDHLLIIHRPFVDSDSERSSWLVVDHALSRHSSTGIAHLRADLDRNIFDEWQGPPPDMPQEPGGFR